MLLSINIILNQNLESKQLTYELYSAGLTIEQIIGMRDKVYGHHYSKSAINNMMISAETDIESWLNLDLEECYPIFT
ncbi:MAG: transposase [Oligoflexus sp.]|nr:transposase [Pseudopedobacter sp.]